MRVVIAGSTDPGGRSENQDAWRSVATEGGDRIVVVADGAGGLRGGARAAAIAVEVSGGLLQQGRGLAESIQSANDAIAREAELDSSVSSMRTTIVALVIQPDGEARWGHVGDSRLYILRDGRVAARTRDDSVPEMLLAQGELTDVDQLRHHPDRSQLLRALGKAGDVRPTLSAPTLLQPGDRLMLCSDGVWEAFNQADLLSLSRSHSTADALSATLVRRAVAAGGDESDNSTVVVVDITGVALPQTSPGSGAVPTEAHRPGAPSRRRLWPLALVVGALSGLLGGWALHSAIPTNTENPDRAALRVIPENPDIQAAIDASQPGDHITVVGAPDNAYPASLRISHDLTITAEGREPVILQAPAGVPALQVIAGRVRVERITLYADAKRSALVVEAGASVSLAGVRSSGLTIADGASCDLDGVHVLRGRLDSSGDLRFKDLHIWESPGAGLDLRSGSRTTGRSLFIARSDGPGIRLGAGARFDGEDVQVIGSGSDGVFAERADVTLRAAFLAYNRESGVRVTNSDLNAIDLTVLENHQDGVFAENSAAITLDGARIQNNRSVGIRLECAELSRAGEIIISGRHTHDTKETGCAGEPLLDDQSKRPADPAEK